MVRLVATGISVLLLAASTQACFTGRYLYLSDDPAPSQELNATEDGEDSGAGRSNDADAANQPAVDGAIGASDGGPDAPPTVPEAGPGPGPEPNKWCVGGNAAEVEPNNTTLQARAVVVGKTCGALTLGDTDWFMMDMGAKGELRVSFEAEDDARLLIQSAGGGVALATGSGGSFNFSTQGRWNLRVVSDTGRVQGYALVRPPQ